MHDGCNPRSHLLIPDYIVPYYVVNSLRTFESPAQ